MGVLVADPVDEVEYADAVIDTLMSPTSSDAYRALHGNAPEVVAAIAVKRILDGGGGPVGSAGGVLSGSYPNPGFAVDMATQAELDAVAALNGSFGTTHLLRYVDYVNGSDSNQGLSPVSALKTIQAAYNNLVTVATATYSGGSNGLAVGKIVLLPGDHNVGSGVVIAYDHPVEIAGMLSGSGNAFQTGANSTSRIYTSSSTATEMIAAGDASHTAYGNRFTDLNFLVQSSNTNLTACIRAYGCDNLDVERCMAQAATNLPVYLLEQYPGNDNAWLRMLNCKTRGVPLYYAKGGQNYNRSLIGYNSVFYGGSLPKIWLEGAWAEGLVMCNNLEDAAGSDLGPAITVGSTGSPSNYPCYGNTFLNNAGESPNGTYPFYDVVHGSYNQFIGGSCTATDGSVGTWIKFAGNSYPNHVWNQHVTYGGAASSKQKLVDNTSFPAENILTGRNGRLLYQKTGGFQVFDNTDFDGSVDIPEDGSMIGCTHDPISGIDRLWVRVGGTYQATTVAVPTQTITFPTTSVLDNFNRANATLSSPWAAGQSALPAIITNQVGSASGAKQAFYTGLSLTADQEVFLTLSVVSGTIEIFARLDHTTGNGYLLQFGAPSTFNLARSTGWSTTYLKSLSGGPTLANGDSLGLAVISNTLVAVYKPAAGSWTLLGATTDSTYATGPDIGFGLLNTTQRVDDFGGGIRT